MFKLFSPLLSFFFLFSTCFTPSLALLSLEQPGSVPAGYQRLQNASSAQMSQLPLPNHAKMLEHGASWQARLQVPQGPTGQQLLRAGVTGPNILQYILTATEGQQRAWHRAGITEVSIGTKTDFTSRKALCVFAMCKPAKFYVVYSVHVGFNYWLLSLSDYFFRATQNEWIGNIFYNRWTSSVIFQIKIPIILRFQLVQCENCTERLVQITQ